MTILKSTGIQNHYGVKQKLTVLWVTYTSKGDQICGHPRQEAGKWMKAAEGTDCQLSLPGR